MTGMQNVNASVSARLTINGTFAQPHFMGWMERHARRLGVRMVLVGSDEGEITLDLAGPSELVDAMELGCLLGPIDVWVDAIRRTEPPVQ
jgi:hypothetical protein